MPPGAALPQLPAFCGKPVCIGIAENEQLLTVHLDASGCVSR